MTELYFFSGCGHGGCYHFHVTDSLENPMSLCRHKKATVRMDGEANRKFIYEFTGFDRKPDEKWCSLCRHKVETLKENDRGSK